MMLRQQKRWAGLLALGFLLLGIVSLSYAVAHRIAISSLRDSTANRLDLYTESVQSELRRYEYLPQVVALGSDVADMLAKPAEPALRQAVNQYLETVSTRAGAAAVYVMDRNGLTLASSNWNQTISFVGTSFSYRPYFQEALRGNEGRFYGIGTVSREPGYYYSHGISHNARIIGVAAVKVNLDRMDLAWRNAREKVMVVDSNGVIFLSSDPDWRFKTFAKLSHEAVGKLESTRQYSEAGQLASVGLEEQRAFGDGTAIVSVTAPRTSGAAGSSRTVSYVAHRRPVPGTDWQLTVLSDLAPADAIARTSAFVAALVSVVVVLVALYFGQRRRFVRELMDARGALQVANDELERKVVSRTADLTESNELLQTEIGERRRAEETLKATLKELVQTAKMAVLGQMSAGITHELNQPLAALRTLSANTIIFLQRGEQAQATSNLRVIGEMTEHMGRITAQLKKFARKAPLERRPVPVLNVVNDACFLLSQTSRRHTPTVSVHSDAATPVALCDHTRLEQVLVNLVSNAFDAVEGMPDPRVEVHVSLSGQSVLIEIHDNGLGISDAVAAHLFEPFFTTKDQGSGLGLGLAISADIVRGFQGKLTAQSSKLGGAMFMIELPAVTQEALNE